MPKTPEERLAPHRLWISVEEWISGHYRTRGDNADDGPYVSTRDALAAIREAQAEARAEGVREERERQKRLRAARQGKESMADEDLAILQVSLESAAYYAVAQSPLFVELRRIIESSTIGDGPYTKPGSGRGYWHRHPWAPGEPCLGCEFEEVLALAIDLDDEARAPSGEEP